MVNSLFNTVNSIEVISLVAVKVSSVSSTSVARSGTTTDPFSSTLVMPSKLPMIGASFTPIVVKLNVLKSGKVRVKVLPQMAILNEKYYSKYKPPPIKSITSALKSIGYSQEFMDSMMVKYKKRNALIEKKWKILEKRFDAPSTASRNKKKKADKKAEAEAEAEAETEVVVEDEDPEEEKKDDDEPEEDEAIVVDEEGDEEEVVEDDYVSDGGDD